MSEETMSRIYLKVPVERVGALIGEKGGTKVELEKGTGSKIEIDGKTGDVVIEMDAAAGASDPSGILKARDIINAIGRGFNPAKAFRLFTEGQMIEVIDLKQVLGESRNQMQRIKGRIIGENGKTRKIIENMTGVVVSVYGHTVSIIGDYDELLVAKEAIAMLIKGAMHGSVYRYLNKEHAKLKKAKMTLWVKTPALKETTLKPQVKEDDEEEEEDEDEDEEEGGNSDNDGDNNNDNDSPDEEGDEEQSEDADDN